MRITLTPERLRFNNDWVMKDDKSHIFIMTEWKVIQERFMKPDDNINLHIKEKLRKIVYLKIMNLKPPSKLGKTKGVHKKVKPTQSDNYTRRLFLTLNMLTHIFQIFQLLNLKKLFSMVLALVSHISHHYFQKLFTSKICHFLWKKHIEQILYVKGDDGKCGYQCKDT